VKQKNSDCSVWQRNLLPEQLARSTIVGLRCGFVLISSPHWLRAVAFCLQMTVLDAVKSGPQILVGVTNTVRSW